MGYLFNFIKPGDPYYPNWVDLRRRRLAFRLALLGCLPVTIGLAVICGMLFDNHQSSFFLVAIPTLLVLVVLNWRRANWPCPRCGKPFYNSWFVYWPYADNCSHCGLPEYAPTDDRAEVRTSQ